MDEMERRESHIELAEKISRIEVCLAKGFAESSAYHVNVNKYIDDLKRDTEQVIHCLYGNGQEGLVTKVATISQRLSIMWAVAWALGIGMTGVLGWFLTDFAQRAV